MPFTPVILTYVTEFDDPLYEMLYQGLVIYQHMFYLHP